MDGVRCSHGCCAGLVVLPLPSRPLVLSICRGCHTVWLAGIAGEAEYTREEFRRLVDLRARHLQMQQAG